MQYPRIRHYPLASCMIALILASTSMSAKPIDTPVGLGVTMDYDGLAVIRDMAPNPVFLTYPELGLTFTIIVKNYDSQRSVQIHEFTLDMTYATENCTSETESLYHSLVYLPPLENYTFLVPVDFSEYAKNQSLPGILGNWTIWVSYEMFRIDWSFYGVVVETSSRTHGLLSPYPFQVDVVPYSQFTGRLPYCSQMGGVECSAAESCSDYWIDSCDSAYCCIGHCVELGSRSNSGYYYESLNNFLDLVRAVLSQNWQFLATILVSMSALLFGTGILKRNRRKQ